MSHRASGSTYHRLVQCAYWARPDVPVIDRTAGEAAILGTAVHARVERWLRDGHAGEGERDDVERIAGQAIDWLAAAGDRPEPELALVYDAATDTARRVQPEGPRQYGELGAMELPTTLDMVWVKDDHVVVRDLKTGSKSHAHREQLVIQGLAAARHFGKPEARIGFLWARKTKCDADPLETLTAADLEAEAWRASSVLRRLPLAQPEPGDGKGCWFCPAKPGCPAHAQPTEEDRAEALV